MLVISVEETAFLMAVGFDVGGIDIKGDALGRAVVAVEVKIYQQILQFLKLWNEWVVAGIGGLAAVLEPPKRRRRRQGRVVGIAEQSRRAW